MEELYKPCFKFDTGAPFSFFWKNWFYILSNEAKDDT
jgi:hypothetical protein